MLNDVPYLISSFMHDLRVSNGRVLFQRSRVFFYIIFFVGYLLSPFDLIPELFLGIFGMVDDLLLLGYVLVAISSVVYNAMVERNREAVRAE